MALFFWRLFNRSHKISRPIPFDLLFGAKGFFSLFRIGIAMLSRVCERLRKTSLPRSWRRDWFLSFSNLLCPAQQRPSNNNKQVMIHAYKKVSYTFLFQTLVFFQAMVSMTMADEDDDDTASNTVESIFDSRDGIKIGGSILAIIAIAVGAVICFAGYKLFRPTLFAVGFVSGGVLIAIAAEEIFKHKSWMETASWIAFVVGGLLIACLVISLYSVGIFVAGAAGGVLLAIMLNTSFGYRIYPSNPNIVLVIFAIVLGIVGGVLAVKLERPILITATSLVGAGLLVWGVGYFAGSYPNANDLKSFASQDSDGDWIYSIPNAWWGYLAGMLVLFIIGMVLQFHKTGRGHHHHKTRAVPERTAEHEPEYTAVQTPQEKDSNVHYGNPVAHV